MGLRGKLAARKQLRKALAGCLNPEAALDRPGCGTYFAARTARSSNGKTTDSDSVNRGSNPRGASILLNFQLFRRGRRFHGPLPTTRRSARFDTY